MSSQVKRDELLLNRGAQGDEDGVSRYQSAVAETEYGVEFLGYALAPSGARDRLLSRWTVPTEHMDQICDWWLKGKLVKYARWSDRMAEQFPRDWQVVAMQMILALNGYAAEPEILDRGLTLPDAYKKQDQWKRELEGAVGIRVLVRLDPDVIGAVEVPGD